MKRLIYYISVSALMLTIGVCPSCKNEKGVGNLPVPVPLKMELSSTNLVMGDVLDVTFTVTGSAEEGKDAMNEDLDIRLSAKTAKGEVDAMLFDDFPSVVTLKAGEKSKTVSIPVKESGINQKYSVELTALARGYKVTGTSQVINVSDYFYTSVAVKNNSDAEVIEGKSFVLEASLDVAPEHDLTIHITPQGEEGKFYEGMPESIIIPAGEKTAETERIKLVSMSEIDQDIDLTLEMATDSPKYPMVRKKLSLTRVSLHKEMGLRVADERWCYADPNLMFVSLKNEKAVQQWGKLQDEDYVIMKEGDLHPGADMSSELGKWKFWRAYEFHPIASCLTKQKSNDNTFESDRMPLCFGNQYVVSVESAGGVDNAKYSWVTDDGFYRMITLKEPTQAISSGKMMNYGTSGVYSCKFFSENANSPTWASSNVRILPGMRIEVRARIRGCQNTGMLPGIWCQGNAQVGGAGPYQVWPAYGEADIMENNSKKLPDNVETTYHWATKGTTRTFAKATSESGLSGFGNIDKYHIYWLEWRSETEVAMGVNGEVTNVLTENDLKSLGGDYPFNMTANPEGMHFWLTMMFLNKAEPNLKSGDMGYQLARKEENIENVARMEIDWVRFYVDDTYQSFLGDMKWRNDLLFY